MCDLVIRILILLVITYAAYKFFCYFIREMQDASCQVALIQKVRRELLYFIIIFILFSVFSLIFIIGNEAVVNGVLFISFLNIMLSPLGIVKIVSSLVFLSAIGFMADIITYGNIKGVTFESFKSFFGKVIQYFINAGCVYFCSLFVFSIKPMLNVINPEKYEFFYKIGNTPLLGICFYMISFFYTVFFSTFCLILLNFHLTYENLNRFLYFMDNIFYLPERKNTLPTCSKDHNPASAADVLPKVPQPDGSSAQDRQK